MTTRRLTNSLVCARVFLFADSVVLPSEFLANFVVLFLSAVKSKCVRSSNGSSCPEISQSAGHNQTVCTDEIIFVLTQLKKTERLLLFARRWVWVGDRRRA